MDRDYYLFNAPTIESIYDDTPDSSVLPNEVHCSKYMGLNVMRVSKHAETPNLSNFTSAHLPRQVADYNLQWGARTASHRAVTTLEVGVEVQALLSDWPTESITYRVTRYPRSNMGSTFECLAGNGEVVPTNQRTCYDQWVRLLVCNVNEPQLFAHHREVIALAINVNIKERRADKQWHDYSVESLKLCEITIRTKHRTDNALDYSNLDSSERSSTRSRSRKATGKRDTFNDVLSTNEEIGADEKDTTISNPVSSAVSVLYTAEFVKCTLKAQNIERDYLAM